MSLVWSRKNAGQDLRAGLVLGVESIPDGLAAGLLAGVNPVFGLYGYLFGTVAGALATSSVFMTVQATGAMAVIIADVPVVTTGPDAARALFTLSVITGLVMLTLGLLRMGRLVRFIPNSVLTGFINAVAVNIVLGQLANLTGYESDAGNRVSRSIDTLVHVSSYDWPTLTIGLLTICVTSLGSACQPRSPRSPPGSVAPYHRAGSTSWTKPSAPPSPTSSPRPPASSRR